MSSEIDEFRRSLVAAVQAELERHAAAVVAEVDRLRDEGRRERAELQAAMSEQVASLSQAIDAARARADEQNEAVREAVAQRVEASEQRQLRRIDDATSGLESLVADSVKPVADGLRDEQETLVRRVDSLATNLRKFDEQAARMVTYFNDVTQRTEQRQDEQADQLRAEITEQVDALGKLVDDNDSAVRRFQGEVGQQVSQKLNDAEDRFNNRLLQTESRIKEDAGQQIASIDAYVGRVAAGLDETTGVINDRITALDDRFIEIGRRIDGVEQSVEGIDSDALEELKNKLSTAAGEAMLVRIEMERFEKTVNERSDGIAVRLTEVESQLADTTMDVSAAVQLDRLEELERAMAELDPAQFVRRDGSGQPTDAAGDAIGHADTPDPPPPMPSNGPDIGAIIAAAEGRSTSD